MAPGVDYRQSILFYDGVCGLCHRLVRFVVKRDRRDRFRFAALQGALAAEVLPRHGKDPRLLDTVYLLVEPGTERERLLWKGRAVAQVLRTLGGPWAALGAAASILPAPLLDACYGFIARRRYRWFGKLDSCPLPSPAERQKFLGE